MARPPAAGRSRPSRDVRLVGSRRLACGGRAGRRHIGGPSYVLDAFLAAARAGDFDALLTVLDPDVTVQVDVGGTRTARTIVGAAMVARSARAGAARFLRSARPVLVNGAAGLLVGTPPAAQVVVGFTVAHGRIVEIDVIAAPAKLAHIEVPELPELPS